MRCSAVVRTPVEAAGASDRPHPGPEGLAQVPGARELGRKGGAEQSRGPLHPPGADDQPGEVAIAVDPVPEAAQPRRDGAGVVGGEGDLRPEAVERLADLGVQRLHVAEGERRGDERHELLIGRVRVAMDEGDRVSRAALLDGAPRAHPVERRLDRGAPRGVCPPGRGLERGVWPARARGDS